MDEDLNGLAIALKQQVVVKDRTYHLKTYKVCVLYAGVFVSGHAQGKGGSESDGMRGYAAYAYQDVHV